MGGLRSLSRWQRFKRRICLWGGSYKHPDGFIELDFEAAAGIDRDDSDAVREKKFSRYSAKQRSSKRFAGAALAGFSMFLLTSHLDASLWEALAVAVPMALGLHAITAPSN